MKIDALNKYLEATQYHLGVEDQRYGGGFRAIVSNRTKVDYLFAMLEGGDIEASEAMAFMDENPLFPSAMGETPQGALQNLSAKLDLLYEFKPSEGVFKWEAKQRFELKAQYDTEPDEPESWYHVSWEDVVGDLRTSELFFYEASKSACSEKEKRNLHALINYQYEGPFATLLK